jgi:hypothetical protein
MKCTDLASTIKKNSSFTGKVTCRLHKKSSKEYNKTLLSKDIGQLCFLFFECYSMMTSCRLSFQDQLKKCKSGTLYCTIRTVPCCAVFCGTVLRFTALYYTLVYSTELCCTVQYCTVLYCSLLYSTILCCTVQTERANWCSLIWSP